MEFEREFTKLNEKQREAVTTIEGPVMVVAGPGTGKTQILALRIANILKETDTSPESILAITFTESGVSSMRKRLVSLIGSAAYRVTITTFHGFSNSVILNNPDSFSEIVSATPLSNIDQLMIVSEILEKNKFELLKPFGDPMYYVRSLVSAISELKREGVAPKMFGRILEQEERELELFPDLYHEKGPHKGKMKGKYQVLQKQIEKNKELRKVYALYEEQLLSRRRYDYSDMISYVVSAFKKDEELLFSLQEQFQYVLVDEHQDTNKSQNMLLELLMGFHENPNLFVVGDEKQSIFRFQGASLENFLYFKHQYPGARLIALTENYRSSQRILDAAKSIVRSELSKDQSLRSQGQFPEQEIEVAALSSPEVEQFFVAKHISERLASGVFTDEVAVLYRDNKDAVSLAKMLERFEIPFLIESDQNIFEDPDIGKLLTIFEAVTDFGNDAVLARVLHIDFLGLDSLDVYTILEARRQSARKGKRFSLYQLIRSKEQLTNVGVSDAAPFVKLYEFLAKARKRVAFVQATESFEEIVSESGFLGYLVSLPNSAEKLEKLNGLFDEVKSLLETHREYRLGDFLEYLSLLREHNVLVKRVSPLRLAGRVRLMTVHRSKGQEFSYVYITGAADGHFGNRRRYDHFVLPTKVYTLLESPGEPAGTMAISEDDERNLFYVALTRAKKEIVISYSTTSSSGREQLASKFVTEINPELLVEMSVQGYEDEYTRRQAEFLEPAPIGTSRLKEKEFVRAIFAERGLSVTGLNNYLACPWRYFYSTLLRIPEAKNVYMMFGTAVHAGLKDFFDLWNTDKKKATAKQLVGFFEDALSKQPVREEDLPRLLETGKEALTGYVERYKKEWKYDRLNEFAIRGVSLAKDLYLTGAIDSMELLSEKEVSVIDYKTGKPKTRNHILGKTKTSNGDYYRQLVFYKLLLSLYNDGQYEMKEGVIDFIQPDSNGKYRREVFEIMDKDVASLKEEVVEVFDSIWNLKFWKERCEEKDCHYCSLREMMG